DLYDPATAMKRTLFETPDLSVEEFEFAPDGRTIFFTAIEKGFVNLYSIPVAGGAPKLVKKSGTISQIHAGAGFIVYSNSSIVAPPDVFRVSADGSATKQLTNENGSWLSQIAMPQY